MVIGISAIIHPIKSQTEIIRCDMWWNIGISAILLLLLFNHEISRFEGILLLLGMAAVLIPIHAASEFIIDSAILMLIFALSKKQLADWRVLFVRYFM